MARRQVDDQPSDPAFTNRGQIGGDDIEVPVCRKRRLGIELGKTALSEKPEVRPKDRVVFARRKVLIANSSILVSETRLDASNDFLVCLGENRSLTGVVGLTLKVAQHREDNLSGLQISRG